MIVNTLEGLRPVPIVISASRGDDRPLRVVGLASDAAVRELKVRLQAALETVGISGHGLVVQLRRGDGCRGVEPDPAFDLPAALECARVAGALVAAELEALAAYGELDVSGRLRAVRGIAPRVRGTSKEYALLVPAANQEEGAIAMEAGVLLLAPTTFEAALERVRQRGPAVSRGQWKAVADSEVAS